MPRQSATTTTTTTTTVSPLKVAIVRSGIMQCDLARKARMTEQRLSRIVQGHLSASDDEQDRLSELLGVRRRALFPPVTIP